MKNALFTLLISSTIFTGYSQIGGNNTYEFLNLQSSARIAALGGNLIAVKDNDVNLGLYNPSLLSDSTHKHLSFSYVNYYADISFGHAVYSTTIKDVGSFSAGVQYVNYGDFVRADNTGNIQGSFSASEYAVVLGYSRQLDSSFSIGANLKPVFSNLEQYQSIGVVADVAGTYYNVDKEFTAALLVKNIGAQITTYRPGNREPVPFEIQLGVSKRLEHMPFRFSVVAHNLQTPDLSYSDPNEPNPEIDPISGDPLPEKKRIGDKIARHFIFGGEFLLSDNFNIRLGYNYMRRQDLKVATKLSTVGISWGLGMKINRFRIAYGRAAYHLAGPSNHFTVTTNLTEFKRKES